MFSRLLAPTATAALVLFTAPTFVPVTPGGPARTAARPAPVEAQGDVVQELRGLFETETSVAPLSHGGEPDFAVDLFPGAAEQIGRAEVELQGVLVAAGTDQVVGVFTLFVRRLINSDLATGDAWDADWHLEFFGHGSVELSGNFPGAVPGVPGYWQAITGATGEIPRSGEARLMRGPEGAIARMLLFFD